MLVLLRTHHTIVIEANGVALDYLVRVLVRLHVLLCCISQFCTLTVLLWSMPFFIFAHIVMFRANASVQPLPMNSNHYYLYLGMLYGVFYLLCTPTCM